VAVLNDEVVGWLWLRTEKDRNTSEKFGYIKSIFVEPSYRHLGFGTELMRVAERYFLSRGIRRTDLIVSAANYDGELFFEEIAFERQHSTMRKTLGKQ
jgi:ribosomal protein S18 acetylase RimI-like enzyme